MGDETASKVDVLEGLDPEELKLFQGFFEQVVGIAPAPPETLWHYTTGQGLLSIIASGTLYATQVSCLNDATEYRYLANLMRDRAKLRADDEPDLWRRELFERTFKLLGDRDVFSANAFVACLSAEADDLGQWRGYGADASAYAIELETDRLLEALKARGDNTMLMRVHYDTVDHIKAVDTILDAFERSMRMFLAKGEKAADDWMTTFGLAYGQLASLVHARAKHPSFRSESEYRVYTELLWNEHAKMTFTAKRSLLARHIPLAFENNHLPIRSVMVGPGGEQGASVVSVGDLLKARGYPDGVKISRSQVPYRSV